MKPSVMLAVLALVLAGCNENQTSNTSSTTSATTATGSSDASTPAPSSTDPGSAPTSASGEITMPNGLKYIDVVVGTGAEAKTGDQVSIHYTGTFLDGTQFDSSRGGKPPYSLKLGNGEVIKGWDEGIVGMKVGGRRKLTIPSELAYGERGHPGGIPPNTPLLFDLELVELR